MAKTTFIAAGDAFVTRRLPEGGYEGFSQLQLVDPTAAACGDIIYDVLLLMGVTLDREIAQAIYIAISTDTGCFRYPNTNAHTLRTAAACYEANDQLALLNQTLFDTNSLGRLRLQGWLVEHAQFFHNGQVVICSLPRAVEEELGALPARPMPPQRF